MSIYKRPPCKKDGIPCDKRHVGCHSECKDYQDWEKLRREELAQKKKEDIVRHQLEDANIRRIIKMKKGWGRK